MLPQVFAPGESDLIGHNSRTSALTGCGNGKYGNDKNRNGTGGITLSKIEVARNVNITCQKNKCKSQIGLALGQLSKLLDY